MLLPDQADADQPTAEHLWPSSLRQALLVSLYYLLGVLLFMGPLVLFLLLMMGMHEMH